jgi:DNA-binding CsgD family transcriptional regulator
MTSSRSNIDLTDREFDVSIAIKRALLHKDDAMMVRHYLYDALRKLYA